MSHIYYQKRKFTYLAIFFFAIYYLTLFSSFLQVLAAGTSTFNQTINPGSLVVDIVNGSYVSVGSPSVSLEAQAFSFACGASTGTFGTATEQLYVSNPDAADGGWTLSIGASAPSVTWTSAGTPFDFNDASTAGCSDGAGDDDSYAGQMTIDASGGTLAKGSCSTCDTDNLSLGSSGAFVEGTTNSITLITAAASSDDIGDWTLQGVDLSQTIPGEQPAASDYSISLTLSVAAS